MKYYKTQQKNKLNHHIKQAHKILFRRAKNTAYDIAEGLKTLEKKPIL